MTSPTPTRRLRMVWKLADLRDPMAISGLIHALKDSGLRRCAAPRRGTGPHRDRRGGGAVATAGLDPESDIASPAARALGASRTRKASEALLATCAGATRRRWRRSWSRWATLATRGDPAADLPAGRVPRSPDAAPNRRRAGETGRHRVGRRGHRNPPGPPNGHVCMGYRRRADRQQLTPPHPVPSPRANPFPRIRPTRPSPPTQLVAGLVHRHDVLRRVIGWMLWHGARM